ncbi:MAG TPA: carboxypeptidase-like regulatory domain-containing protein [Acidobacteriaceae bacterium]|nr:carboxypeptidase-like regulatory domain-containing protein [Acidobacteriaceae bacterium]
MKLKMIDVKNQLHVHKVSAAPRWRRRIGMLLSTLALSAACFAQVERATITGTLTDKNGAVVPGATVHVIQESTNETQNLQTDSAGEYTASNLTPGSYTIEAEKEGFTKRLYKNFVVQVGQTARLDMVMDVGSVTQSVEVTGAVPILQNETASVGQVITPTAVQQLPLNGRNMTQLAVIAPGVTGLNYAPTNTIGSGIRPDELRPGGTTIEANGARDSANKLLLDGVDDTEMIAQTQIVRPSVESLQEFNIITSNAGPEYDRGGGAILVTSTRSGSNDLHGSVYEYIRNSAVDAKNYFVTANTPIPLYRLNDLGGRLGGPIKRDRAFFFVNYEGYFEQAGGTQVSTVPTMAERQGNFQGVANIYDPLTTVQSGSTYKRTQFANNIIPASRFDPIAYQLVNAYPLPQTAALVNNIVTYPIKKSNDNRGDARVDYQISPSQTFFARYSIDDTQIKMPNTFNDIIGGNEGAFSGPEAARGQQGVLAYNKVISSNLVGEYRFGFNRFSLFLLPSPLTSPIWAEIPGRTTIPGFSPSGSGPGPVAPIISPAGFGGMGNSRSEPLIRREHLWENIGDISWQKGKHNFKFGIDTLHHLISESDSPPGQSPFGRFNFDSNFSNNPASPTGTGNSMASFLLGFPSATVRDLFLPGTAHVFADEYNVFAGDIWRITPKLTLNIGLHYEVDTPYADAHDYWVNFNPVNAAVEIAGKNGVSKTANWQTDYGSIGPRVGFAYTLDAKTVFRGGYGAFYDPQANAGTTIRQERQWPFDLVYALSPGSLFPSNTVSQGFLTPAQIPAATFANPFGTLQGIDHHFKNASTQQYNLSAQRQLTGHSSFTIGYVGAISRHLSWHNPIDQPLPGPGNIQARREYNSEYPNVTAITYLESVGVGSYSSLQTSFQQQLSHGFFLTANYVWSHTFDNSPSDGGADGPIPQDPTNRNADYSSSNNDIRNRVNVYGTYELPFGPGRAFLNSNSFLNRFVVGGWQANGIFVGQSGLPFTVTISGTPTNTGASSSRADVVAGVPQYPAKKTLHEWFNPAAFIAPTAYNWGNVGRNSLRGPDEIDVDSSVEKHFPITEGTALLFRLEFFNMLNHPQFQIPAATINAGGAGTITGTSNTARQMQAALRLTF